MSTYKSIKGESIIGRTSNFTSPSTEGQIFYNTTDNAFRSLIATAAWSSTSPTNSLNMNMGFTSESTQTTGLIFGGYDTGGPPYQRNITESYNGSGWTSEANLNTARNDGHGFGSQTAAGFNNGTTNPSTRSSVTEEYNGTSWTTVNSNPHSEAYDGASGGPQTAAWRCAGYTTSDDNTTQEYDGTNWTSGNAASTSRYSLGGTGSQTSAIIFAGLDTPNRSNVTEEYDGTSWTAGGTYPTSVSGVKGFGYSQTTVVGVGGGTSPPSIVTTTCTYDGSSWTNSPATLGDSASAGGVGGSNSAGFYATGIRTAPGTSKTSAEEYNVSINTITAGAWASGGNLPAVNNGLAGAGVQNAALAFGSRTPGQTTETYEYDGSSWTASNDINYAAGNSAGLGTQTAAVSIGGGSGGASNTASSSYDGSSWTANNVLNGTRSLAGGAGTSTAGLAFGGFSPSAVINTSEHWDGTNWTTSGNMNTARMGITGAGTQSNAAAFGGINYPASVYYANTEDYNGSTWTNGPSMNAVRNMYNGGDGAAASGAWAIAGDASSNPLGSDTNFVELYNETTWVTQPALATGRRSGASTKQGTSSSTLFFGGRNGSSDKASTEEFTGETSALGFSTITTS